MCVWPSVLCFCTQCACGRVFCVSGTQCACGRVFCVSAHSVRVAECFVFLHTMCVWPSVLCFCTQCACGRVFCVSIHSVRLAECSVFLHTVCVWPSVLYVYTHCACGLVFCMYAVCVWSYASIPKLLTEYDENSRCQLPVKSDKADLFWSVFQLMHFESRIPSA